MAMARSGTATIWATQYHMGKVASSSVARHGELGWCRRCEFYLDAWTAQDSWEYTCAADDIASCKEDLPWVEWLCDLDTDGPSWERAAQTRCLSPH